MTGEGHEAMLPILRTVGIYELQRVVNEGERWCSGGAGGVNATKWNAKKDEFVNDKNSVTCSRFC